MELKIYSQDQKLRMTVSPSDSSAHVHELMGENVVNVSFTWPEYVQLDVNDYIELDAQRYTIRSAYQPTQKSTLEYQYNVKFYGRESEAQRVKMLYLTDDNFEPKFSLDGSPAEHLQKVIDNLNRINETGTWVLGSVIAAPNKNIEYNNVYCSEALALIAEAFETEWWIEGNTLNLSRCEYGDLIELGYMNGLTELNREENADNVKFFTRLIPLGTTRNIDKSSYGFSRLQLPDRAKYVENNTEYGLYEEVEEEAFSAIYPRRIGKVSSTRSEEKTGEDKQKFNIYYFKDTGLDFNPNDYDMEGLVKHIVFQSGELNGRDFEVNYNATEEEFEIITQFPDENSQLPGGHLIPGIGDEYILYNLKMPTEYITAAEQEYKEAVDAYLAKFSIDSAIYRGNTDYIHIAEKNISLRMGRRVRLLSDKFFPGTGYRDSRITKVTRKLNNLAQATIECTNAVGKGRLATIESDMTAIKNVVADRLDNVVLNMLRTWDSGDPTDYNLFSSLRVLKEIKQRSLSRLTDDDARGIITFLQGALFGNYSSGLMGAGGCISIDPETGQSYLEVDRALFRMKAIFTQLVIDELAHVGGSTIWSPARMKCVRVEELENVYRCYFTTTDGEKTITNNFIAGDQARVQEFNIKPGVHENVSNRYYWRLVTAIGDDYIDLSKTDCDADSGTPKAGDEICQLGHRTDKDRQNAIVISSYGPDAPNFKQYAGINSYSLAGKEVTSISPNNNSFTGKVTVKPGSSGYSNLTDKPDLDAIGAMIKNTVAQNLGYNDFASMMEAASKGETIISNGIINTDLIFASVIITSQMIVDAIQANSLNVNNKFIIAKDGTFKGVGGELMNMVLTGSYRSPFKNGKFRWHSDSIIGVVTPGIQDNNNVIIPNEDAVPLHCELPCSMDYDGFCATILNEDFEEKRTEGPLNFSISDKFGIYENGVKSTTLAVPVREGVEIQGFSDGTAFRGWIVKQRFKSSTNAIPVYGEISVEASPETGGTVTGGGSKIAGTTGIITAMPNSGYSFLKWQDGLETPSREVTWNESYQRFIAYFANNMGIYTITVASNPTNAGTTRGSGQYNPGERVVLEAIANPGYAFSGWNDGDKTTVRVVTCEGDKTYIASFVPYTPSVGELLTNTEFTNTTGIALLTTDAVGNTSFGVFNKILLWSFLNYVSGTFRGLTYNKGLLTGKLIAGKKYRFTVEIASVSNIGKKYMILIGTVLQEPIGQLDDTFSQIGTGETMKAGLFVEGYTTVTMEFTTSRTATAEDCIVFLSDGMDKVINIKNPSLKEI